MNESRLVELARVCRKNPYLRTLRTSPPPEYLVNMNALLEALDEMCSLLGVPPERR